MWSHLSEDLAWTSLRASPTWSAQPTLSVRTAVVRARGQRASRCSARMPVRALQTPTCGDVARHALAQQLVELHVQQPVLVLPRFAPRHLARNTPRVNPCELGARRAADAHTHNAHAVCAVAAGSQPSLRPPPRRRNPRSRLARGSTLAATWSAKLERLASSHVATVAGVMNAVPTMAPPGAAPPSLGTRARAPREPARPLKRELAGS